MSKFFKYIFTILLTFIFSSGFSQEPEMADTLRSNGKIYVVILIILIVLGGLIIYLFLQDRKLNKLEKMLKDRFQTK